MTKLTEISLAIGMVVGTGVLGAQIKPATPAPAKAPIHAPATTPAPTPADPTAPTVDASELDTLRITNAVQDFQLNQTAIQQAQAQVDPMRQKLIQAISAAAMELKLTPDYQWDFQQKKFVRQQMAPAAAPAQADKK